VLVFRYEGTNVKILSDASAFNTVVLRAAAEGRPPTTTPTSEVIQDTNWQETIKKEA
jgi:hypothetical protein